MQGIGAQSQSVEFGEDGDDFAVLLDTFDVV